MKSVISYFTILIFIMSCSTSQYATKSDYVRTLSQSTNVPDIESCKKYVNQISDKLDSCIITYDPLMDFWDQMVLLPIEPYIIFNDDWMEYINQKSKEYNDNLLPECKAIVLDGFKQIGIEPKEKPFPLLRAEFVLACLDDPNRELIRIIVFDKLTNKIDLSFTPIYQKAKLESQNNNQDFDSILNGENKDIPFWKVYNLVYNYGVQEEGKLKIRMALDQKYSAVIIAELNKWVNDLKPFQKDKLSLISLKGDKSIPLFIKTLKPNQYFLIEKIINKAEYIKKEKVTGKERGEKLINLVGWLKNNKERAQQSRIQEDYIKAERAQAIAGLLMGFASCLIAYTAWRNAYYNSYRVRQFQIYDNFGNFYQGTVR